METAELGAIAHLCQLYNYVLQSSAVQNQKAHLLALRLADTAF